MKKILRRVRRIHLVIVALLIISATLFGNTVYIQAKAVLAQHLIAEAWNQTQQKNTGQRITQPVKPWSWADTYPVAKLTVPKTGEQYYVLAGATGSPLAFGPGLYSGTALPGIREEDIPDTIVAGHHNTHFEFLKHASVGEELSFENHRGEIIHYRITAIRTADIRTSQLEASYQGNRVTLVTCQPSFIGEIHPNQRLVVTAEAILRVDLKNIAE